MRELAQALASEAADAVGADRCLLLVLRRGLLIPLAEVGAGARSVRSAVRLSRVTPAAQAVRERRPVLVPAGGLPAAWALPATGAVILMALRREGRRVGLLLFGAAGRDLGEREAALAAAVAPPVAHVLRLVSAGRRAAARLRSARTLLRVNRSLGASLELRDVMQRVAGEATRAVRADSAGIYVLNDAGRSLELVAAHHAREQMPGATALPLEAMHGLNGAPAWSDGQALQQELFWQTPAASRLLAPLRVGSELVGLLVCAWWARPRRPSQHVVRLIQGLAGQAAVALAHARLYARAEARAVDRERTRLDAMLHDTLSQTLFSLGLKVHVALSMAPNSPRMRSALEGIKRDAAAMSQQVRHLMAGDPQPMPPAAAPAADQLMRVIQEFRELTGVPVVLVEAGASPRLGRRQLDVLSMIVQAGLASLAHGAGANRAEIRLDATSEGVVRFAVRGAAPAWSMESTGRDFPPAGIVERVGALGGWVEVARSEPDGFCLSGALPLNGEGDGEDPDRPR
jgi:signal transduction histidine kinase